MLIDNRKDLIKSALTPDLQTALNDELEALHINHIPLELKPTASKGEMLHKIELVGWNNSEKFNLTHLLSEGEQTVIAIAGFLAELKVSSTQSPIVFDDPVCSLDHRYRQKIAERLVNEAKARQVLVFTHDIVFLLELQAKAAELQGTFFLALTLERSLKAPGKCVEELPWHAMPVSKRIAHLNTLLNDFQTLYGKKSNEYNQQAVRLYGLLRQTWEAAIEERLFHRTVMRHDPAIHTLELRYVTVTDEDYIHIYWGMTSCSKWADHDLSKAIDVNLPDPKEVQKDIATLSAFTKSLAERAKDVEKLRNEKVKPPLPSAG